MRQNYVTFDFNNFDADGLASVKREFEKAGLTVTDIEANNRSRRMSGFATKMARFFFQDGQSITLRIKGDGDVFQVQLNSRIIPIQQVDNMKGAIEEMARMATSNAPAWKKAQRRKQQRAKVNTDDLKARSLPRGKQIEALESEVSELRATRAELESENAALNKAMEERRTTLQTLEQQVQAATS
ncbi:hypothetical protein SIL78_18555 [Halomonas alkaliphila]|uniref:Defence against restriction A N-terminal domain-containing protein n=1 Tax=Vreelandella alkaliphila TaxID=272774 RepID=A0AAJ2S2F0_9GAMM|nr:hypothetical protein [Halomonas alkaliphila]MDX5979552.1 hypothetical protein [Halomonas alkaliphila]